MKQTIDFGPITLYSKIEDSKHILLNKNFTWKIEPVNNKVEIEIKSILKVFGFELYSFIEFNMDKCDCIIYLDFEKQEINILPTFLFNIDKKTHYKIRKIDE